MYNRIGMIDKNKNEKCIIEEFAIKNVDNKMYSFPEIDILADSYYIHRKKAAYIREYSFDSFMEVNKELESLWSDNTYMSDIIPSIAVAILKNRPVENNYSIKTTDNCIEREKLPAYIYNF